MLSQIIKSNRKQFLNLCKSHKIKTLFAFGSSITSNFSATSDIDLVVDIEENDPLSKGELLLSLWDKFELFFNRKVDLLTNSSIKNPVLKENIDSTKLLIYDGKKEEILL